MDFKILIKFETTDFYHIHVSEEQKKKEFERINFEEFQEKHSKYKINDYKIILEFT